VTYLITQSCCNDASCVPTCPVDCIHPAPGEPGYMTTEMLYIDPETCIECSACAQVCPVDAIVLDEDLTPGMQPFLKVNADYYARHPLDTYPTNGGAIAAAPAPLPAGLRVAVVGSGPSGSYAASLLLKIGAEVDVYECLLTPLGLVRFGVAPDHASTKSVSAVFPYLGQTRGLTVHLGVEVGKNISHAELLEYHHAVIYAVGASVDRRLGIPGEDLPGSHSATDFVAWYNGHPDAVGLNFDLSSERAVVVGNGNVALDVARILTSDPDRLARTDIADHALAVLRESAIREVVVVGRRGPVQAAYTVPELLGLINHQDFDVIAIEEEVRLDEHSHATMNDANAEPNLRMKAELAETLVSTQPRPGNRRIVLRYLATPTQLLGSDRVEGISLAHNVIEPGPDGALRATPTDRASSLDTGLVLRSIGYRGKPIADLPFDTATATVPNTRGRVHGMETPAGTYVTGWIKRGPSGVIGTNKQCAAESVASLAEDLAADRLEPPTRDRDALEALLAERCGHQIGLSGWTRIDAKERSAGASSGRPRVKIVDSAELFSVANETPASQATGARRSN
jgi:ferredoxin/flavodoxin---NADP+ reductase